jgi:FeS assembly SUF system protein
MSVASIQWRCHSDSFLAGHWPLITGHIDQRDAMDLLKLCEGGDMDSDSNAPESIEEQVIDTLRTVYDPEIPVNVYELGLVYGIQVNPGGEVIVRMTLTSPGCPVAGSLPPEVEQKVLSIPGVQSARVDLVWDPPWNPGMMSDAAKLQLGIF